MCQENGRILIGSPQSSQAKHDASRSDSQFRLSVTKNQERGDTLMREVYALREGISRVFVSAVCSSHKYPSIDPPTLRLFEQHNLALIHPPSPALLYNLSERYFSTDRRCTSLLCCTEPGSCIDQLRFHCTQNPHFHPLQPLSIQRSHAKVCLHRESLCIRKIQREEWDFPLM
mmetsp:Transcript_9537/g.35353  ORF Transcript_9537/g.35353 Transcript_9537/m.35353 type:complete len:173 (+) Transcript_9537:1082-1600(+)